MINLPEYNWAQLGSTDILPAGHKLNKPHLLFEKIEDEAIDAQLKKLEETKKANEAASYVAEPIKMKFRSMTLRSSTFASGTFCTAKR